MKVKELKMLLDKFPPDSLVTIFDQDDYNLINIYDVRLTSEHEIFIDGEFKILKNVVVIDHTG